MRSRQDGFISFSTMTLLIGGAALGALLAYGSMSGQELPLWPAIAVSLVNLVAAGKLVLNVRAERRRAQTAPPNPPEVKRARR